MPRASRDGASIYYERDERSDDADETVVFLQGLGYGRWLWRWQREALGDEYDVIAPDTRGTGRSDAALPPMVGRLPRRLRAPLLRSRASYSIEGLAADLEAVLADADVDQVHLVGASMGGMIAMQYALEYDRAASLTVVASSHGGPDAVPVPNETREQIFDVPSGASERRVVRHRMRPAFTDRFTNRNPHLLDRIIEWRLEQDADEPAREAQAGAALDVDLADQLEHIHIPTLVVHGSEDRVLPVENGRLIHEKLPDSQYLEVDGGSHLCFIEQADRVTDALVEFLAAQRERSASTSTPTIA